MHHFCYGFCGKHEVFPFIQNLVRDFAVPLGLSAALLHELVHAASGISQVRGEAPRLQLRLSRSDRRSDMARLNTDAGGGQDCHILYDKFAHPLILIREQALSYWIIPKISGIIYAQPGCLHAKQRRNCLSACKKAATLDCLQYFSIHFLDTTILTQVTVVFWVIFCKQKIIYF